MLFVGLIARGRHARDLRGRVVLDRAWNVVLQIFFGGILREIVTRVLVVKVAVDDKRSDGMVSMDRGHNFVIIPYLSDLSEQLEIADNAEPDVEVECYIEGLNSYDLFVWYSFFRLRK